MYLEEAYEHMEGRIFPDTCEDEIEDMLADPDLDPLDREALEEILDNI
jgi:hypothetical protein